MVEGLEVDLAARAVLRDGEPVHLTPIEFELLRVLVRNRGRLMTHRKLLAEVWGPEYVDDIQPLRTHIARLRAKIEPEARRDRATSSPIPASGTDFLFSGPLRGLAMRSSWSTERGRPDAHLSGAHGCGRPALNRHEIVMRRRGSSCGRDEGRSRLTAWTSLQSCSGSSCSPSCCAMIEGIDRV